MIGQIWMYSSICLVVFGLLILLLFIVAELFDRKTINKFKHISSSRSNKTHMTLEQFHYEVNKILEIQEKDKSNGQN